MTDSKIIGVRARRVLNTIRSFRLKLMSVRDKVFEKVDRGYDPSRRDFVKILGTMLATALTVGSIKTLFASPTYVFAESILSADTVKKPYHLSIYRKGDIAYLADASGHVLDKSSDHPSVFQTAIEHLKKIGGGVLLVYPGEYIFDKTVYIQNAENIIIEGAGYTTKIVTEGDTTPFVVGKDYNATYDSRNIVFRKLYFDCSSQSFTWDWPESYGLEKRHAIAVAMGSTCFVDQCYFYGTASDSVYGRGKGYGPRIVLTHSIGEKLRGFWGMLHTHIENWDGVSEQEGAAIGNIVFNSECGVVRHEQVIVGNLIVHSRVCSHDAFVGGNRGSTIIGNMAFDLKPNVNGNYGGIQAYFEGDVIVGNIVIGNTDEMPSEGIVVNAGERHLIAFNRIENCKWGILFRMWVPYNDIIIVGNCIKNCYYDGIYYDIDDPSKGQRFIIAFSDIDTTSVYDCIRIGGSNHIIVYNFLRNAKRYGIFLTAYSANCIVENNVLENAGTKPIYDAGTVNKIRCNIGYKTENSGVAVLSGDGTTTDFLLGSHGLDVDITDPTKAMVECTPASPDAIAASPLVCYLSDEDADGIYESIRVKFASAPAAGTNNVKIVWEVEYIGS